MDFLFAWYFPPELVKDAPRLRWISSTGAGVDNVMAARDWLPKGVPVTRMVHVFDDVMAEYVLGYLLAVQLDVRRVLRQQEAKSGTGWSTRRCCVARRPSWSGSAASAARSPGRSRRHGLDVIGVSRTGQPVEGIDEVHPIDGPGQRAAARRLSGAGGAADARDARPDRRAAAGAAAERAPSWSTSAGARLSASRS